MFYRNRRRLTILQYFLFVILMIPLYYMYLIKQQPEVISSHIRTKQQDSISKHHETIRPIIADSLAIKRRVDTRASIEPFSKFDIDTNMSEDSNETLFLLDLWNGDTNCSKYEVRLLKKGSQPHPGALVSFPGSGNSWLRVLLMGLTGVFAKSIYSGEDALFQSKGNDMNIANNFSC